MIRDSSSEHYTIRPVAQEDTAFLWDMLFYAAHMDEDGATSSEAAKQDAFLAPYVEGWGQPGDVGVVAVDAHTHERIGAAWVRLLGHAASSGSYDAAKTPELALAVLPSVFGKGVGSALLRHLLDAARLQHPAVMLSVRADNPAARLYKRYGFEIVDEIVNRVGTKSYVMLLTWADARGAN